MPSWQDRSEGLLRPGRCQPRGDISMNASTRREFLESASVAVIGLSAFPFGRAVAAESKRKRLLYFTASVGYEHPPVVRTDGRLSHSERVMTEFGKRAGFEVECTKDGRVF